jgi:ribonuclease E
VQAKEPPAEELVSEGGSILGDPFVEERAGTPQALADAQTLPSEEGSFSGESPARDAESEFPADMPDESAAVSPAQEALAGTGPVEMSEIAEPLIEQLGAGDGLEEVPERRRPIRRNYKIQEVIKRRQILLVQVVKEERGNKGAALTTYLSLAGRYSVLMPNTARGGGISRKITNAPDRKRLKSVAQELDVPDGMGVIVRTAGAARTKAEIKRDFEYLLRLWENVRELTLKSSAPALVHEEGSLIKRAIRDLYNKDIDEVLVAGEEGYKEAKDFMRMLAPSHAKVVKLDKETEPVFARFGIERQLDAMFSNIVTLRSGGYVVINQTEALVAIDVNSGRATREHNIEDTALKTNLEAAEEVARQLRLRDLAGLIVIDFIDMDEKRNNRSVEKRLKDCLKNDRARIQVGSISPFGLLEMSRQRIRSGVVEGSSTPCPHCAGAGRVRSTPSVALHVLRHVEDALVKNATRNLIVRTRTDIALYILNQKRRHLRQIEDRFGVSVNFVADDKHNGVDFFAVEPGEPVAQRSDGSGFDAEAQRRSPQPSEHAEDEVRTDETMEAESEARDASEPRATTEAEGSQRRRRRRRRRRGGGERDTDLGGAQIHAPATQHDRAQAADDRETDADTFEANEAQADPNWQASGTEHPRKRRRGRRGGRARRDESEVVASPDAAHTLPSDAVEGSEPYLVAREATGSADEWTSAKSNGPELQREPSSAQERSQPQPAFESEEPRHARFEAAPEAMPQEEHAEPSTPVDSEASGAEQDDRSPGAAPAAMPATSEPVLVSTYDPARAKRAGWWSKTRTALTEKE